MSPLYKPIISPILIGREQEFATLENALNTAIQRRGQTFLLAGDAGVGKTRLLNEFYLHTKQFNVLTIRGYAFEEESAFPFSIWINALRDFSDSHTIEEYDEAFRPFAADLLKLVPEVTHRYPGIAPTPPLGPETERRRIFDALLGFFINQARSKPILIVLEDVHWSDKTSLDFLLFFVRRISTLPILIIISYRHREPAPNLQHFIAQLDRERLCQEIVLNPLTRANVEQMSTAILEPPRPLHSQFINELYTYTEGNPFYVEEVLKLWHETGELQSGSAARNQKSLGALPIPRSVVDAVQRRTVTLSPQAKHILAVSAVIGRMFNDPLLAEMFPDYDLVAILGELFESDLIYEEAAEVYAFRHAITREVIYASLLRRERKQVHQQVAETMERYYARVLDRWIGALAYHAFEAGMWQKAFDYSVQAGQQAQSLYAAREAIVHFSRAIEAASQMAQTPSASLFRARGKAYEVAGDFELARADYEQTLALAQQGGDGVAEWQALIDLGFLWAAHDYSRTGDYFQRALILARTLSQTSLIARSLNRVGNWYANVEQPALGIHYHDEALSLFTELNDPRGLAETYDLLGMAHQLNSDLVQSYRAYPQAIALWRELQDRAGLAASLACLPLCTASYLKNLELSAISLQEAITAAEEARHIAKEISWRAGEAFASLIMAMCLGSQGEYTRALEAAQVSLRCAEEIEHSQWIVGAHVALATIYFDILNFENARAHLEQALTLANEIGSQVWIGSSVGYLASTYVAIGRLEDARALLDKTLTPATPMQLQVHRLLWFAKAEAALARNDAPAAEHIIQKLIDAAANQTNQKIIPRLSLLRGKAIAAQEKFAHAQATLLAANHAAIEQDALPLQWRIQAALGKAYQSQTKRAEADTCYAAARIIIHALAAKVPDTEARQLFLDRALATLPAPSIPTPNQIAKQQAGGLTAREREIALLLAQGKSNQEIADELVVGIRTVEAHITRILNKLDFTSRVQIATWIIERKLTL